MEVLFLTEGGKGIGMGHISRCSALADGFMQIGHSVRLQIRGEIQNLKNLNNYKWNKIEWFDENILGQLINNNKIVIVDSYLAPQKILKQIGDSVQTPVFLVDSKLNYYPKGIILFPSLYAKYYSHNFSSNLHLLSGKEFLLFDKRMWNLPTFKVRKVIQKVGISLGAFINEDIISIVCDAIQTAFKDVEIDIFGYRNHIFNSCKQTKNLGFLSKEKYIEKLYEIDMLIVNGGISLNEALLVGIPSISVITTDNQISNANAWEKLGMISNINPNNDDFKNRLVKTLNNYKSFEYRKSLNMNSSISISSKGAMKAAMQIIEIFRNKKNEK